MEAPNQCSMNIVMIAEYTQVLGKRPLLKWPFTKATASRALKGTAVPPIASGTSRYIVSLLAPAAVAPHGAAAAIRDTPFRGV